MGEHLPLVVDDIGKGHLADLGVDQAADEAPVLVSVTLPTVSLFCNPLVVNSLPR